MHKIVQAKVVKTIEIKIVTFTVRQVRVEFRMSNEPRELSGSNLSGIQGEMIFVQFTLTLFACEKWFVKKPLEK